MVRGFLDAFDSLVALTRATSVYEVGCGEGYLSCRLLKQGVVVRGSDLELVAVEQANSSDRSTDEFTWTEEEETKVRRKLDRVIVPLTTFLYLLCFLDR